MYGGGAPKPDPSVGKAQLRMADLAIRQNEFFEKNLAPRFMTQLDDSVAISRRQADAQEKLQKFEMDRAKMYDDRWQGVQVPLEDQLIDKARKYNDATEQEQMAGTASADVSQAFGRTNQSMQRGLSRRGVSGSSGAALALMKDSATEEALAKAGAMNMTREAARQMGWTRLGEATALGRGLPGFGAASTQLAGNFGMNAVGATNSSLGALNSTAGAYAQNTSTQGNLWGNVGQLGVGLTQARASGGGGGGIGALVGGVAGSFFGPMGTALGSQLGGMMTAKSGG